MERCGHLKFKVDETIFAANQKAEMRKDQKNSGCKLGHCEYLVMARHNTRNRPGLDAIHINGNWGSAIDEGGSNYDCFCRH